MCRKTIYILLIFYFGLSLSAYATTTIWGLDWMADTNGVPFVQDWVDLLETQGYIDAVHADDIMVAHNPSPQDGALYEVTWAYLMWTPGVRAISHDVYMGTDFNDVSAGSEESFTGNTVMPFMVVGLPEFPFPEGLQQGTTYYWRVDEINNSDPNSPWRGDVWRFTVTSKTAVNPSPVDGAVFAETNVTISWRPGDGAVQHDVYLSVDLDAVLTVDVTDTTGIYRGRQSGTSYIPSPALYTGRQYFWRIDEVDADGTVTRGIPWSFTLVDSLNGDGYHTSESAVIDSAGGRITVSDDQSSIRITLSIPYGALKEPTTVTLTSLDQKLDNPISDNILPGVRIEPDDLLLREPATLEIYFEDIVSDYACVFVVMQSDMAIPIADQTVGNYSIKGQIYYFKQYVAGVPTEEEIITQVNRIKEKDGLNSLSSGWSQPQHDKSQIPREMRVMSAGNLADCPPIGYGWQGTHTKIHGLLKAAEMLHDMGNYAAEQDALDAAKEILEQDIESFLEKQAPEYRCGSYARAAFRYGEQAQLFGIYEGKPIQKLCEELIDQCSILFTIEIDAQDRKNYPDYYSHETLWYGTVTAHIPLSGVIFDGDWSVTGEGHCSVSHNLTWDYRPFCTLTEKGSGTMEVTCSGQLRFKTNEAGQTQPTLYVSLKFKNDILITQHDTCEAYGSGEGVDDHVWYSYAEFPFVNGATHGGEYFNPEKGSYVKYLYTLHIINFPPGSEDDSDSECY